ncbi:hypothetical protein GGD83_004383 [Rhodoblastus sphagnicola]|uniref:hypothetical protein n=1 Tax=Rhodoblastus sphagnicola TaxID=333368 RepID=UPI00161291F0|nr:hypothetical protein [Rhodoblastus sphagnicola]MBB4200554.1 hypothetical protein [Rhodoblastus sphagnicola]
MAASLFEILRSVPDHRRREGQRFELATVLLALEAAVAEALRAFTPQLCRSCFAASGYDTV